MPCRYLFQIFIDLKIAYYYRLTQTLKKCQYALTYRRTKIKHNYLNNKDILKEIHKSKTTYCSFTNPEYSDYDLILDNVKKINKKNILAARKARAERLGKLAHERAVAETGEKQKLDDFEIKYTKIPQTDVVFRIMTWEHIPLDDVKTQKAKNAAKELYEDEDEPDEEQVRFHSCNLARTGQ